MANMLKGIKNNMRGDVRKREASPIGALTKPENISPKLQKEIDVYNTSIMKLLHSKETSKSVIDMLASAPMEDSVPATALQINAQLEQSMKPKLDVVLAGSVSLVGDLIEIASASGMGEPSEGDITMMYQDTLQKYIEDGVKSGKIDPVQLQKDVEPLMTDEQRALGTAQAQETGMPMAPTSAMATDKLVNDAVSKERENYQGQQGLLSNMAGQAVPNNKGMGGI